MAKDGCQTGRQVLARGTMCTVERCSCGTIHLTVGVMTVRLQLEVVASVWETVGEALAKVAGTSPLTASRPRGEERPS